MKQRLSVRKSLFWILLLVTGFATLQSGIALTQDESVTQGLENVTTDEVLAFSEALTRQKVTPDKEAEQDQALGERIEATFDKVVNKIAGVLFYELMATEREFVQFDHREYYVRPVGSPPETPYTRLTSPIEFSQNEIDQLTPSQQQDIAVFRAIDESTGSPNSIAADEMDRKLIAGEFEQSEVATGTTTASDGEEVSVEFFSRVVDAGKYVKVSTMSGDEFHLLNQDLHQKIDSGTTRTANDIQDARAAGLLALTDTGNYLQTESVNGMPIVVLWLACGALFFTLMMRGYNIWGFRHAVEIVRGKYDNPDEDGEVTHFQALSSALSATVGLGNIAGVTIAMTLGGPGAFFWMLMCGFFGMTSKFVECTLGQKYRKVKEDGTILGGPMQYLPQGLSELKLGGLGAVLGIMFTVMCILASFGGGNMFQSQQAGALLLSQVQGEDTGEIARLDKEIKELAGQGRVGESESLQLERDELQENVTSFEGKFKWVYGIIMAALVGVVIIGGIKRIGKAAEKIVPSMCLIYVAACLYIILANITDVPAMISLIFSEAFSPEAFGGGFIGILVIGVQRAAFSNEAGVGSASIAHSAAKTDEPVREGTVALLGPFIDTIIVCSMTALVILLTGAWDNNAWINGEGLQGAALTSRAFGDQISWFPVVLTIAVVLFAYSTMISWSYYGEKCWERLFGANSIMVYRLLFVAATLLGALVDLGAVLSFSDIMILCMAFPNVLGVALLSPKVYADLKEYWGRYKNDEFKIYK